MKIELSTGKIIITESSDQSLMKILLEHQIPVASSCNGDGICGKCKVEVVSGGQNISSPTEAEILLKNKFGLGASIRISCQCFISGDVSLRTGYW